MSYVNSEVEDQIFPGFTYTGGGKVSTLKQVQQFGIDGTNSLPPTTFQYADNLHMTRAENGYGGAVEFSYDAVPYYDAEHVRSSQTVIVDFGADGQPCGPGLGSSPWVARGGVGSFRVPLRSGTAGEVPTNGK